SDNGYAVRYSLLGLARLGVPSSVAALETFARDPKTTSPDRFYALAALARIAAPPSLPIFWASLDDACPGIRRVAQIGLVETLGPHVFERVLAHLDDPGTSARTSQACQDLLRRLRDEAPLDASRGAADGGASGGSDPRTE